jgi:hypothetical protein
MSRLENLRRLIGVLDDFGFLIKPGQHVGAELSRLVAKDNEMKSGTTSPGGAHYIHFATAEKAPR